MQHLPQIIMLCLTIFYIGKTASLHGQTYTQKGMTFKSCLMFGLQLFLLAWGGFMRPTVPFILFCVLIAAGIGLTVRDEGKVAEYKIGTILFANLLMHGLYFWGGFYDSFLQF